MKKGIVHSIMVFAILVSSCKKLLNEDVKSQITDNYINTPAGFQDGVKATYSFLKTFYGGDEFGSAITVFGTDEFTNGSDGGNKSLNQYTSDLNPRQNTFRTIWNNLYLAINACNTVITRAPNLTSLADAEKSTRVAEVKFLRAQYYFLLVQLFGPVHLSLTETESVVTTATRAPLKDIYDAIISDLNVAILALPIKASDYGRATKPAAENLLAKVYLTRASSEAKQSGDYAKAAELSKNVINNYGFKLTDDFEKVFEQGAGEKNSEVIWSVQNNKDLLTIGTGNTLHLYFLMEYDVLPGMKRDVTNGKPFKRFKPTDFTLQTLFNRQFDGRYEKTFKRVFFCNNPGTYAINGRQVNLKLGDTAVYVPDRELTAGELAKINYNVYPPSKQDERRYPTLTKFLDPQRPNLGDGAGSRDVLVYRLAETYLVAAEALMMSGNSEEAAIFVNIVRSRAAKIGASNVETTANRLAMQVTPAQLDIDFILDERSRELLGENMRWLDLVRTGKLVERVKKYNPAGAAGIKPFHVLRPIPQEQIDRTSSEFKQNPGY
ncbi:hypothetical protein AAKU52_002720 [Pedobacter sp. CG_S7]|uniref:RagB/SusD family nutrient uptake outer membrane protein n=1 Tax=Pedobacter sp. CG_S7 TaxID=3143930 RepID=UPI0033924E9E